MSYVKDDDDDDDDDDDNYNDSLMKLHRNCEYYDTMTWLGLLCLAEAINIFL